jgi:hypothetical protein
MSVFDPSLAFKKSFPGKLQFLCFILYFYRLWIRPSFGTAQSPDRDNFLLGPGSNSMKCRNADPGPSFRVVA